MQKIMVVDDEFLLRYSLSTVFRNESTEVFAVADGKTALDCIQRCCLDVCFLDIHLPDMNGLDIMRKLRDISPHTRIIIMTGSLVTRAMMESIQENAHCLISKPFDLDRVREAVSRVLTKGGPLSPEKSAADENDGATVRWITDDYRKHRREPTSRHIFCSLSAPHDDSTPVLVSADVIDISASGMCLLTKRELQPGHLVHVSDAPLHKRGVVRWSAYSDVKGSYRAGVQFVAPENISHLMRSAETLRSDDSPLDRLT